MQSLVKWVGLVAAAGLASMSRAQDVPVEKYKLPNGMTVILRPDHTVPLSTVNIWYSVGSKDEPPHHSGFAHLFEHLMFMGSFRVPTGHYDKIMEGGGGDNNASTAEDRTNYYDQGPANLLPTLLWLESDRLEDLGRAMTLKKLNLQRDVVKNERRQNTENTPYGSAYEMVNGLMFPTGHPYHTSVIGSMSDLDNGSVKDVQQFFARYYVPNNASMVVAGDFDPKQIKTQIAKLFGTLPRRPAVPRKPVPALPPLGVKRITLTDKVEVPKLIMTWHSPAAYKPGDAQIQLAASVLADGLNSRLYQRLVVKDKLATAVSAFQEQRLLGSVFYVDLTASHGASLQKLQAATDEELARFTKNGPTKVELMRQSAKIESNTLNGLQSLGNVADTLNAYQFYLGEPNSFRRVLDTFRNSTPAQVREVAAKTLKLNDRVIITVLPRKVETPAGKGAAMRFASEVAAQKTTRTTASARDHQPSLGTPKAFVAPTPVSFTLSNGMPVYYWRRAELPLMSVDLQLQSGTVSDGPNKDGLANLTAELLTQGAGKRDSQEFQNALDLLGADVSANSGRRRTSVRLNVLARNFGPALKLYADSVIRPKLAENEFARVKRVTLSEIEQSQDDVSTVAGNVASREYYGVDSPLGQPVTGTPTTVGALTLSDVKQEHSQRYGPKLGAFYAAGSLSVAEIKAALNKEFGSWSAQTGPAADKTVSPSPASSDTLRVFLVDKPGAVQTAIRFLMPSVPFSSPKRLALNELGTILGGSFTSRLNQNLREDKGYTYGAGARFALDKDLGSLMAAASVRADVTGASLKEFLKEFDRIRGGDVTHAETAKASATLRTETINQLATVEGLTQEAGLLAAFGRPLSSLNADEKKLNGIGASDLNELVKSSIPYEKGVLILVGDKATVLKQLQGLNLPEPKIVTAY